MTTTKSRTPQINATVTEEALKKWDELSEAWRISKSEVIDFLLTRAKVADGKGGAIDRYIVERARQKHARRNEGGAE